MDVEDGTQEILNHVRLILDMVREGSYDSIDLTPISRLEPSLAEGLNLLIQNIKTTGKDLNTDVVDLSIIKDHLDHVTQSFESGVLTVINTAETVMNDTNEIRESLETLNRRLMETENPQLKPVVENAELVLGEVQNNCFTILTSLEMEDINRQLLERIVTRLDQIQGNLHLLLSNLKIRESLEKKDSAFLDSLKHIIDLEGDSRQSQEDIDDLFEDFGA